MNSLREESPAAGVPLSTGSHEPPRIKPWGFVILCLASAVLILTFTLVGGGWMGAIKPPLSQRLYMAEGVGTQECQGTFDAPEGWEIRWEHSGTLEEICWTDSYGVTKCFTAMPHKPIRYHGSVNVDRGGRYSLKVAGTGTWKVEAYRLFDAPR